MRSHDNYLREYLKNRPLFLSLLRSKEAYLYQKYLPLDKPVIDIGCGDGFFAKIAFGFSGVNEAIGKIEQIEVGLDIKESRISKAKKQQIYKNTVIYNGKVIPFDKDSFSTAISNSVLEHVSDLDQVLTEINRILKPGGTFLTTVMTKRWEDYLWGAKILGSFYKDYMRKKQVHINLLTKKEWDKRFKYNGFRVKKCIGHLDKRACQVLDVLHYVSLPSLISYKLFGKWVLWPGFSDLIYPRSFLWKLVRNNTEPERSGALFYELIKQ